MCQTAMLDWESAAARLIMFQTCISNQTDVQKKEFVLEKNTFAPLDFKFTSICFTNFASPGSKLNPCVWSFWRYSSGSYSSGPSAIQPAATCKASTTWSLRSLSSTFSSTLVSSSRSILSVTCCRSDSLLFFFFIARLASNRAFLHPARLQGRGFMTSSFREWTPRPLEIVFSFVSNLVALLFPLLFRPSVHPHFSQIWIFQTWSVFNCALEHYLSKHD